MKPAKRFLLVAALAVTGRNYADAFLLHFDDVENHQVDSSRSLSAQQSNVCNVNETFVVYQKVTFKKGKFMPSTRARCCPRTSQIKEPHRITNEICPLMSTDGDVSLPEGLEWASVNDTSCPHNFTRPACCSNRSAGGYCQIYHDRTVGGLICPIGRAVCCPRLPSNLFTKGMLSLVDCSPEGFLSGVRKTHSLLKGWMTKEWKEKSKFSHKFPQHKKPSISKN